MNLQPMLFELMKKYSFRPTPVLDQFFLVDSGAIEREVRYASLSQRDTVLEVGPGMGFLTEPLAKNAGHVIAVEKDKRLEPLLRQEFSKHANVEFVFADFLNLEKLPPFNKVVSNIPYSISAPLTFKLLEYSFEKAVLCYQKEFAQKMVAPPGPDFGRLSVMVQYYFDARVLEVVPRGAFYPQPKVDSAFVLLVPKPVARDPEFDVFVREVFRYPSKDVHNAVKHAFGKEVTDTRKMDSLSVDEVRTLYEALK